MEDIYTIKVRSNPDPRNFYPSERRYSASIVLGLSVVHITLAITVILLTSLTFSNYKTVISSISSNYENFTDFSNHTDSVLLNSSSLNDSRNDDMAFMDVEEDENVVTIDNNDVNDDSNSISLINLTVGPSLLSLGAFIAGIAGLFAWKKWYIDQNIKWFFFLSFLSILTSLTSLTCTSFILSSINENQSIFSNVMQNSAYIFTFNEDTVLVDRLPNAKPAPNLKTTLTINLIIASVLELIWSILSARVAYKGMKNNYPDDIFLPRGKLEVNTVRKGNKNLKNVAPDILNHYPKKKKFAKYFPKNDNDFLPKPESNFEYQERVNKFLSGSN